MKNAAKSITCGRWSHIGPLAFVLTMMALPSSTLAIAQAKAEGVKLAKETVSLIGLQEQILITAVRQKDSRDGLEDFRRFVAQPITSMQNRWQALPREDRANYSTCITALQEFSNHAADSFKAGRIGQPSRLFKEARAKCVKG